MTIHGIDGDRKTCTVVDWRGNVAYIYQSLSWRLVSKLQERDRSREESKLYEPFGFMPQEEKSKYDSVFTKSQAD